MDTITRIPTEPPFKISDVMAVVTGLEDVIPKLKTQIVCLPEKDNYYCLPPELILALIQMLKWSMGELHKQYVAGYYKLDEKPNVSPNATTVPWQLQFFWKLRPSFRRRGC